MNAVEIIAACISAYLLGSVPSAVWIGKAFHKIDVREHGSGNAGATNTIRVLGWKTGIPVLLIDLAKGWTATMLPVFFNIAPQGSIALVNMQIAAGLIAILGHVFPLFAGFRGGKGVATVFGALLAIHPLLTISCIGIFLLVFLATGIVSVASMIAGLGFPVMLIFFYGTDSILFRIFSVFVAIALLVTHRKNIGRLMRGEEKRLISFKRNKSTL